MQNWDKDDLLRYLLSRQRSTYKTHNLKKGRDHLPVAGTFQNIQPTQIFTLSDSADFIRAAATVDVLTPYLSLCFTH